MLTISMRALCIACLFSSVAVAHDDFPHWRSLFDGASTKGWTAAKPDNPGEWQVVDGALTQKDKVDFATTRDFGDYELEIEFRSLPDGHGNSGVYLRGQVEVQIFNSTPTDKVAKGKLEDYHGGAIYGGLKPLADAHKKQGEWNKYRILHIGDTISVWLNDAPVQKSAVRGSATPGQMTVHALTGKPLSIERGPIMLQGDHDTMFFRNIRIRELDGWKPVWNGYDLSELAGSGGSEPAAGWRIDGAAFTNRMENGKSGQRDCWTRGKYGNFLVHYEYRSDPAVGDGNSGFYLRDQWEIQINKSQSLTNKHGDAAFYSIYAPAALASSPAGEWNSMDVKLQGNKASVWQNGKLIHDGAVLTRRTDSDSKTAVFSRAPFKLQGDHDLVWFRNIYIKEMPDGE